MHAHIRTARISGGVRDAIPIAQPLPALSTLGVVVRRRQRCVQSGKWVALVVEAAAQTAPEFGREARVAEQRPREPDHCDVIGLPTHGDGAEANTDFARMLACFRGPWPEAVF